MRSSSARVPTSPAEAEQRWGDTDAWQQSQERTSGTTARPTGSEVKAEIGRRPPGVHRRHGGRASRRLAGRDGRRRAAPAAHARRFYDCSYEFHRNLADMYVSDPRFTATYDDIRPGMAHYVRDAIHANADRHGS